MMGASFPRNTCSWKVLLLKADALQPNAQQEMTLYAWRLGVAFKVRVLPQGTIIIP